jgi:diamine N-acetyltransferase
MPRKDDIRVRTGLAEDTSLLSELGRQTFFDSFAADNHPEDMAAYLDASFSRKKLRSELADPSSIFLIAEIGGEAAGYARLLQSPGPPCIQARRPLQLVRIYACNRWIGHGVGPALMAACIKEAHDRQCDGIWLGVWNKNSRAFHFYRKWGFFQAGTQPFQLGNDRQTDLILWLPLTACPQ